MRLREEGRGKNQKTESQLLYFTFQMRLLSPSRITPFRPYLRRRTVARQYKPFDRWFCFSIFETGRRYRRQRLRVSGGNVASAVVVRPFYDGNYPDRVHGREGGGQKSGPAPFGSFPLTDSATASSG